MVNTLSSETWVVGPGGCASSKQKNLHLFVTQFVLKSEDSLCASSRGALFDYTKSSTWQAEGFFELGADVRLGGSAYAQYGLDNLTFGTTGVILPSAIVGSLNTTEYWLGYFGLGNVPGNFTNVTPLAAIAGLFDMEGVIPSQSYGFTAGAKYREWHCCRWESSN